MLDLRRVRVFYEVAQHGSFSAAADALGFTQPSISHHISALEHELGQRLINRAARPLALTPAGEALHHAAAIALAEIDRAETTIQRLASGEEGHIALGSVVTGLRTIVPAAIRGFTARYPNLEVRLAELQPTKVLEQLRSGRIDIGIIVRTHNGNAPDPTVYTSEVLVEQQLVIGISSRHPLARRQRVRLATLSDEQWLLPSPARFPEFRAEVDQLLADAGITPRRIIEITDDVAGARLTAAGMGIVIVPDAIGPLATGVTGIAITPQAHRHLLAVTIRDTTSKPVRGLLDELRKAAQFAGVSDSIR